MIHIFAIGVFERHIYRIPACVCVELIIWTFIKEVDIPTLGLSLCTLKSWLLRYVSSLDGSTPSGSGFPLSSSNLNSVLLYLANSVSASTLLGVGEPYVGGGKREGGEEGRGEEEGGRGEERRGGGRKGERRGKERKEEEEGGRRIPHVSVGSMQFQYWTEGGREEGGGFVLTGATFSWLIKLTTRNK